MRYATHHRAPQAFQLPLPLMAACAACDGGVKRTHLVDAHTDGALLLELYSRDGVGAMISADFYEARGGPAPSLKPYAILTSTQSCCCRPLAR